MVMEPSQNRSFRSLGSAFSPLCRSHCSRCLQVYLSPFVKAMSPPEAAALRPLLEKKASAFVPVASTFDIHLK